MLEMHSRAQNTCAFFQHGVVCSGMVLLDNVVLPGTGLKICTNANFRDFFMTQVLFRTEIVKSENFMHSDWSEEKFLKGSVGHTIRQWGGYD